MFIVKYNHRGEALLFDAVAGACIPKFAGNSDYKTFLAWNAAQPVPLDLSDRAPDPVPEDADKSPLDGFLAKADAGTLTQKDINETVVRMVRRLRKGL